MRVRLAAVALSVTLSTVVLAASAPPGSRMLTDPALSADRIAFIYGNDIWTCRLDGGGVSRVTSGQGAGDAPRIGIEIRGTRKDIRIEDVVAANGSRRPDAAAAPKVFRQAFIYLVAQTREASDDLNKLEAIRAAWETFFRDSTDGRGTMIARLR